MSKGAPYSSVGRGSYHDVIRTALKKRIGGEVKMEDERNEELKASDILNFKRYMEDKKEGVTSEGSCPSCGFCKHCGRGGVILTYPSYPSYPTYPSPWYPTGPVWTSTTTNLGGGGCQ